MGLGQPKLGFDRVQQRVAVERGNPTLCALRGVGFRGARSVQPGHQEVSLRGYIALRVACQELDKIRGYALVEGDLAADVLSSEPGQFSSGLFRFLLGSFQFGKLGVLKLLQLRG